MGFLGGGDVDTSAQDAANRRADAELARAEAEKIRLRDDAYDKIVDVLSATDASRYSPDAHGLSPVVPGGNALKTNTTGM